MSTVQHEAIGRLLYIWLANLDWSKYSQSNAFWYELRTLSRVSTGIGKSIILDKNKFSRVWSQLAGWSGISLSMIIGPRLAWWRTIWWLIMMIMEIKNQAGRRWNKNIKLVSRKSNQFQDWGGDEKIDKRVFLVNRWRLFCRDHQFKI